MFNLAAADVLSGVAASATAVTYTISGMELNTGIEAYKILAQGQLPSSVGTLYTAPSATQTFIKSISLVNATGSDVSGIKLYLTGTTAAKQITGSLTIPANGWATYEEDGWRVYNALGQVLEEIAGLSSGGIPYNYDMTSKVMNYNWSTTTSASGISAGQIRLNTTTPDTSNDVQVLYMHNTDANAVDLSGYFAQLITGSAKRRQAYYVTIYTADTSITGQRFRVLSVTIQSGYVQMAVLPLHPSSTMPSNAAAVFVKLDYQANHMADAVPPMNMAGGNGGLYGFPDFTIGGQGSMLWGTAARLRGVMFRAAQPIQLDDIRFIASGTTVASSACRAGYSRVNMSRSGTLRLGPNSNHINVGNAFASAGLKIGNANGDILEPGYWFAYIAVTGVLSANPTIATFLGNYNNNENLNANASPLAFTTEYAIAADYSGGSGPPEGTAITQVTGAPGASFTSTFAAPFLLNWRPLS
jgi:hypothetical protein